MVGVLSALYSLGDCMKLRCTFVELRVEGKLSTPDVRAARKLGLSD